MQKREIKKLTLTKNNVRRLSSDDLDDVGGAGRRTKSGTCGTADDYCLCKVCF